MKRRVRWFLERGWRAPGVLALAALLLLATRSAGLAATELGHDGFAGTTGALDYTAAIPGSVTVGAATGGTGLSADTNFTNGTAVPTQLTGPTITEGATGDVITGTLVLSLPSGFAYENTTLVATVSAISGSGNCFRFSGETISGQGGSLSVSVTDGSSATPALTVTSADSTSPHPVCKVVFSGIEVLPTAGNPLATTGDIVDTGTAQISGLNTPSETSLGILSEVAGSANQLAFTTQPAGGTGGVAWTTQGQAGQPVVTVQDQFGNTAASGASIGLTITSNPGGANLQCTTNPLPATGGTAAFSGCEIDQAGNGYTLTAASSGLTSAVSSPFNITVGQANQLAFTEQPSGGSGGLPWAGQPQVTVEDAGGNTVTSSGALITLAITRNTGTAGATLGCANLTVPASNGIAVFSGCEINLVGTRYTLTASNSGLNSGTSSKFNIIVGPVASLPFTNQPGPTVAGQIIDNSSGGVQVTATDLGGNPISGDTVTISINSGSGGFASGTTTVTTDVNGNATFNNLVIDVAGNNYSLLATDTTLVIVNSPTSNTFAISPAAATTPVFINQPTETGAGQAIDSPIGVQVKVTDAFNNPRQDLVTMSVASGPGTFSSGSTTKVTANASGIATFTNLILATTGAYTLKATNGAQFAISQSFNIVADTTTTPTCSPSPVGVGIASTCTATVADTSGSSGSVPTGTVSWSASGGGTFSATTCTLNSIGQCTVTYRPNTTLGSPQTITASYGDDSTHATSSGTFSLPVTPALVFIPFVAVPAPLPQIVNGGFGTNLAGWNQTTNATNAVGAPPISQSSVNDGSVAGSALLGSPSFEASCNGGTPGGTAAISQSIQLPDGYTPTLHFSYRLVSQDSVGFDSFSVYANTPSGTSLFGPVGGSSPSTGCPDPSSGPYDSGWRMESVSLQAYEGKTVTLYFQVLLSSDGINNTYVYVDDVSVSFQ